MAEDWIPMRTDLWDCPQVVRILSAKRPKASDGCPDACSEARIKCEIIGAMWRTWSLFDTYSKDGKLEGYTESELDRAVGIEGWSADLQHVGWLVAEEQLLIMPDFESWMSRSAKRRAVDAKRKRQEREKEPESVSGICPKGSDKIRTTIQDNTIQEQEPPKPPKGGSRKPKDSPIKTEAVFAVYSEFHPRAKLGTKDSRLIRDRLAEGYSVEDLQAAIRGCHKSPWHCGKNDSNRKYQSLSLILRDSDKVAQFIECAQTPSDNGKHLISAVDAKERARGRFRKWAQDAGKPAEWIDAECEKRFGG